jgi:G:T-mismatch repair DNA endonuclease (very short patch repair protein)
LKKLGWSVLTVWQCQLKKPDRLARKLDDFLST